MISHKSFSKSKKPSLTIAEYRKITGDQQSTNEEGNEFIDEKHAKKLLKYKVVKCLNETFSQLIRIDASITKE